MKERSCAAAPGIEPGPPAWQRSYGAPDPPAHSLARPASSYLYVPLLDDAMHHVGLSFILLRYCKWYLVALGLRGKEREVIITKEAQGMYE